jgi:hypothetical protein
MPTMCCRRCLRILLTLVLALPLVQATLLWVGGLLAAMGDAAASRVLHHVNTTVGVTWALTLVAIVVLLAVRALDESPRADE